MDILDSAINESGIPTRLVYRAYVRAYRNADALYYYIFERWRNDWQLYADFCKPVCDARYGVHFERA